MYIAEVQAPYFSLIFKIHPIPILIKINNKQEEFKNKLVSKLCAAYGKISISWLLAGVFLLKIFNDNFKYIGQYF